MISTIEWAKLLGIPVDANPPPLESLTEPYPHTAREIAVRAVILQGVIAVASNVDPQPIISWFQDEEIWEGISPNEKTFLLDKQPSNEKRILFRWRQEAEWTLLWMIGKVEALGLPTQTCDSRHLVDDIIPALGSSLADFLASAKLRQPELLYAEDNRIYDLWCRAIVARRENMLPADLNFDVLYERRYAFEWANGKEQWDKVTCDA